MKRKPAVRALSDVQSSRVDLRLSYGLPRKGLPAASSFRRWVVEALRVAMRSSAEVCIRVCDSEEALALNRDYRSKAYATNVLSFPADLPPGVESDLLGDLAICAAVVEREAVEQGKTQSAHFAHLTIHGVLHLLGHDHIEANEAEQMERLEILALSRLGYPDPYA